MDNAFYISEKDWDKIQNYARTAHTTEKSEIGGMLIAIQDKDGDWELRDPVILKQKISASNCILDQEALAIYYSKIGAKFKNKDFRFVWWHSHHTMAAFWSGTDLTAIKEYSDGDYSFALVINLKEEYKLRISVWKPFEIHEDVELTIIGKCKSIPKRILDEVEEKCSKIIINSGYVRNGWNNTVEKSNQMTLVDTGTTKLGGQRYNNYSAELSGDSPDYVYAYNQVDEMNKEYCDGRLTYEGWIAKAKQINAILQNTYKSIYLIDLITESILEQESMIATPHEYISIDAAANYDSEYEDWVDMKSYNNSFGVD